MNFVNRNLKFGRLWETASRKGVRFQAAACLPMEMREARLLTKRREVSHSLLNFSTFCIKTRIAPLDAVGDCRSYRTGSVELRGLAPEAKKEEYI